MRLTTDAIRKLVKKLNLDALRSAASDLSIELDEAVHSYEDLSAVDFSEDVLRQIHHLLFDVHVKQGNLKCPKTGRKFPIKDGIPNMILHEDEI